MSLWTPRLTLCAELAALSYRPKGRSTVQHETMLQMTLEQMGLSDIETVDSDDVQAYRGKWKRSVPVIVFRGTDSVHEMGTNLLARKVADPVIPGVSVHSHFGADAAVVHEHLDWGECLDPELPLLYIGHSRGGAAALIAACRMADARNRFHGRKVRKPTVISFCAPRSGCRRFAAFAKDNVRHIRLQNRGDVVPMTPLWPWYSHDVMPWFFDEDNCLRRDASTMTRVWETFVAILHGVGTPGLVGIDNHALNCIEECIRAEENWLPADKSLLEQLIDLSPRKER